MLDQNDVKKAEGKKFI